MNWDALGAIAETVGALATILMLWYLARQIGQNTHATKFASFQTSNSEITQLLQMDPKFGPSLLKEIPDLQDGELGFAMNRISGFFNVYEVLYYQYLEGGVLDEVWKSREEQMLLWLALPMGRTMWMERKKWYSEPFRKHVDALEERDA